MPKHRTTITVSLRTSPPSAVAAGEHVAVIRCTCGWDDEHPNGTAAEVRARAEKNAADHRRERPAPFSPRALGIVR